MKKEWRWHSRAFDISGIRNMNVNIETAHNTPEEREIKKIIEDLLRTHTLPLYTEKVCIDSTARSHSHPVLTISTKRKDPRCILKTFVHEQMHWLHNGDDRWEKARAYFKEKYPTAPTEFAPPNSPRSFWTHIIVCWNTENYLKNLDKPEYLEYINETCPDYVETTKLVRANFETIGAELKTFGLVSE